MCVLSLASFLVFGQRLKMDGQLLVEANVLLFFPALFHSSSKMLLDVIKRRIKGEKQLLRIVLKVTAQRGGR